MAMPKILKELQEAKASASSSLAIELLADVWVGSGPYTYDLAVSGLTTESNGYVGLNLTATSEQYEAAALAQIRVTSQSANTITLTAAGEKPSVNIPVIVVLV